MTFVEDLPVEERGRPNVVTLEAALNTLLTTDAEAATARARARFDEAAGAPSAPLVLCGAGPLGRSTLAALRSMGIEPLAFVDNRADLGNQEVDGLAVSSPVDAIAAYGSIAVFVVTVYNPARLCAQLTELGAGRVVHYAKLYWKHAETMLPYWNMGLPTDWTQASDRIRAAFQLLSDSDSRQEFISQLRWRLTLDSASMPAPQSTEDNYFSPDLISWVDAEVFVDCGAYDGDTLRDFVRRRRGEFESYVAFEPDPSNFRRLSQAVERLEPNVRRKVQTWRLALGSRPAIIRFDATGTVGSTVVASDGIEVQCATLDEILSGIPVTYIKMDIEGAESSALAGGAELIARERPVLGICLYHKPNDLWELPLQIHRLNPDYRLFLRRYAEDCWETVCYAIPPHRLAGSGASGLGGIDSLGQHNTR